jgi:hypothetical protein
MMVQEPHIREFAETLKQCLDRALVGFAAGYVS